MTDPTSDVRLLGFIGHHDRDILPLFLDHYRTLGVGGFLLALHGAWPERSLDWLTRQDDVAIWDLLGNQYEDSYRRSILHVMAERYRGCWVVLADADEFLELPYPSLTATVRALEVMGLDCLPAYLLQRLRADGDLPVIDPERSLDQQFPFFDFGLCEEMGVNSPVWKTKYPLAKVTEKFGIDRGNHWPPNPMSLAHAPVRGLVHHVKWRAALWEAFEIERGPSSNTYEMTAFRAWLDTHDGKLPTANARPYSRNALIRQGLLVKPNRHQLSIGSLRHLQRATPLTEERQARLIRKRNRLLGEEHTLPTARDPKSTPHVARAVLVTFDLSPPLTSGGIGTAMHALAEQLAAAGMSVDLLFCPYEGPEEIWQLWYDYWANRGVRLHYLPRREGKKRRYLRQSEFLAKITEFLERHRFDLVHVPDAAGYGSSMAILRAAGLGFEKTKLVVTAHGGVGWHRRGNRMDRTEDEAEASFAEWQMLRLADVICCPSEYMREHLLSSGRATPTQLVVLPNALASQTRSFGVAARSVRPVDELVMMGRIEPRKGIDRFADAVKKLTTSGKTEFRLTFLGSPGQGIEIDDIHAMLGPMGQKARFITGYDHIEAVNYVKTHDCLVVIPSLRENLPYSLYECLENHVPVIASDAGGMAELVAPEDRERILVADDPDRLVQALEDALAHGMRPASLAFEPSLVGLKLVALHEKLGLEARSSGGDGASDQAPNLNNIGSIVYGDETTEGWVNDANRRANDLDHDLLYFRHTAVRPEADVLPAMTRLITRAGVDAVVVGYRVVNDKAAKSWGNDAGPVVMAPGGPGDLGATRNLFGAGLFLIKRSRFLELGGFQKDLSSSTVAHWDLLNRLAAAGGNVIGIPKALANIDLNEGASLSEPDDPVFAERLAHPWLQIAADPLQGAAGAAMPAARAFDLNEGPKGADDVI